MSLLFDFQNLSDNKLGSEGAVAIKKMLTGNSSIRKLEIAGISFCVISIASKGTGIEFQTLHAYAILLQFGDYMDFKDIFHLTVRHRKI